MPEGHTIHRLARRHSRLVGRGTTVSASTLQDRFAAGAARLDGASFARAEAYGKHLFHRYTAADGEPLRLHVHLGLYGKFTDGTAPAPPARGALRLRLLTEERWFDLRGPIACELVTDEEVAAIAARLGPDPLARRRDPAPFLDRVARSRAPIARLLMDQAVVAGVGNVYRAEVLFRQRVPPMAPGRDLDGATREAIWEDLVGLLAAGVRSGRIVTTLPEHRARPSGRPRSVDAHYVYRRDGQPCRLCGTPVARAELDHRNLFWCPHCQAG
ncbi:Fpg/Nei family DNA glycosylase [Nocardioidaceae bacterium]|nr:Fpg/Nei family DNA glycosylase [Nocardioidaceae bacterium]